MLRPFNLIIAAVVAAGIALVLSVTLGGTSRDSEGAAQSGGNDVMIGLPYKVDAGYVRRSGQSPAVGFEIILPKRSEDTHTIGIDENPTGGIVQFNFHSADEDFLESLFIAPIPIAAGDMDDRLAEIAPRLAEQGPELLRQRFENVTAEPVREVMVGTYRATELTGTYLDPRDEARYAYRFLALPDPERVQSLYAVSHVNQAYQSIDTPDAFADTLSGKALSMLRLTAPPQGGSGGGSGGQAGATAASE